MKRRFDSATKLFDDFDGGREKMPETCPPLQTWRVWPAHGCSFTIQAHCAHRHIPGGDWTLNREGGEVVAVLQACGTVLVNETVQDRDEC